LFQHVADDEHASASFSYNQVATATVHVVTTAAGLIRFKTLAGLSMFEIYDADKELSQDQPVM